MNTELKSSEENQLEEELKAARAWLSRHQKIKKVRKFPRTSKMYKHLPVILDMKDEQGASFQQIASYLKWAYKTRVTRQAVAAYYHRFCRYAESIHQERDLDFWLSD